MTNDLKPAERFLSSPHAKAHQDWCRSDVSKAAIEAALAQMVINSPDATQLVMLAGANRFARILIDLAEPPKEKKPPTSNTLRYA